MTDDERIRQLICTPVYYFWLGRDAESLLISGLPDRTEEIHPTGNVVRYTHEAYKIFFAEVDRPVLVNNTWAP